MKQRETRWSDRGREGGAFFRFTVGAPGSDLAYLSYISRESAVLDGRDGVLLYPEQHPVARTMTKTRDFGKLCDMLLAHAWLYQQQEKVRAGTRSHYRVLVSFKSPVPTERIRHLMHAWLSETLPRTLACGFVHRDAAHVHAHLYIPARGIDGRKLNLDARAYRRLSERYTEHYERTMEKAMEQEIERDRIAGSTSERGHRERGQQEWRQRERDNGLGQKGPGSDQPETAGESTGVVSGKRVFARAESASDTLARRGDDAIVASRHAVQEFDRLRACLAGLDRAGQEDRRSADRPIPERAEPEMSR